MGWLARHCEERSDEAMMEQNYRDRAVSARRWSRRALSRSWRDNMPSTLRVAGSTIGMRPTPVSTIISAICPIGASAWATGCAASETRRSEEHTSELQSLMRISYAVFCLKKQHIKLHNKA